MVRLGLLAAVLARLTLSSSAMEYEIASCDDFSIVDDQVVTGLIITSDEIACDTYTRFRVRNMMTITATVPMVTFSNLSLKVLGNLTVEPDVIFQDVVDAPTRGGALYVQLDASATFMGTALFQDLSVAEQPLSDTTDFFGITKKGGAIHNKGSLTFEESASFLRCEERTLDSVSEGYGGAVFNSAKGSIVFKGNLTMVENDAKGTLEGEGGAIFNRGDIIVEGEAYFGGNSAGQGAAIAQGPWANMIFNGFVTFFDNMCAEIFGGAIANFGGDMTFNAGVLFEDNFAESSGEGGVGGGLFTEDGGVITLIGTTTFRANRAGVGGAIFLNVDEGEAPVIVFPEDPADLIFEDNEANVCPDIASGFDNLECISAY